jgi:riboflavin kinase, archaea type
MAKRTKTLSHLKSYALPKIVFKGTVFSGKDEGRKFIELPWVKRQIEEKLDFTPYSGTLNIKLSEESTKQKKLLSNITQIEIYPEKDFCKGILIKAYIDGLECAIIIPEVPHYPSDVLEVIAPWYLRERLKLSDGNIVTVIVDL